MPVGDERDLVAIKDLYPFKILHVMILSVMAVSHTSGVTLSRPLTHFIFPRYAPDQALNKLCLSEGWDYNLSIALQCSRCLSSLSRNVSSQGFSAQDSSDCENTARAVKPRLRASSQETKKKL